MSFVLRDGQLVDKATGKPMLNDVERQRPPSVPQILAFSPYACPITGKEIRTPQQHRDNLKKHNCVEAKELGSATNGEIRNARFAKKHGLDLSERYKDEPWKPKTKR